MTFNPNDHMIKVSGKDYLKPAWRLVWFREEHPQGVIITELLQTDPIMVVRASVYAKEGELLATGLGMCVAASTGKVYSGRELEKAETAAIGRALAHAGYGTQFSEDDGELEDSPVERRPNAASKPAQTGGGQPNAPAASSQDAGKSAVSDDMFGKQVDGIFGNREHGRAAFKKLMDLKIINKKTMSQDKQLVILDAYHQLRENGKLSKDAVAKDIETQIAAYIEAKRQSVEDDRVSDVDFTDDRADDAALMTQN